MQSFITKIINPLRKLNTFFDERFSAAFLCCSFVIFIHAVLFLLNRPLLFDFHSWYGSLSLGHLFFNTLRDYGCTFSNLLFSISHNYYHTINPFSGILIGGVSFFIGHIDLNLIFITNSLFLLMFCVMITKSGIIRCRRLDVYIFAALIALSPEMIGLSRAVQTFYYSTFFLFTAFICLIQSQKRNSRFLLLLSSLFICSTILTHRLMLLHASFLALFGLIFAVKQKKASFISIALLPLLPAGAYAAYYISIGFADHELISPKTAPYLSRMITNLMDIITIFGPTITACLICGAVYGLAIMIIRGFKVSFSRDPLIHKCILMLIPIITFSSLMHYKAEAFLFWFVPSVPFIMLICVRIFEKLPNIFKGLLIAIKILSLSILILNTSLSANIHIYFTELTANDHIQNSFDIFHFLFRGGHMSPFDYTGYINNNIPREAIEKAYYELNKHEKFLFAFAELRSKPANTLMESYVLNRNKRLRKLFNNNPEKHDTMFISIAALRRNAFSDKGLDIDGVISGIGIPEDQQILFSEMLSRDNLKAAIPRMHYHPNMDYVILLFKINDKDKIKRFLTQRQIKFISAYAVT